MIKRIDLPAVALLLTLGLFGFASFYPLEGMWGINHLRFLPDIFTYIYWVVCVVVIMLLVLPFPSGRIDRVLKRIADFVWDKKPWGRLTLVVFFILLFYVFRTETHFLGDGYTLLSLLAEGQSFTPKWVEPGSTLILRQLESLLGGYARQTSLLSCQILSIISGSIVVYNFISITGKLSQDFRARLLSLVSLLFSGAILLFFGYVEHYPLLWAASAIFINSSLKFLKCGRGLWLVFTTFAITVLMHFQAIYFLGGTIFLIGLKFSNQVKLLRLSRHLYVAVGSLTLCGVFLFIWLYRTELDFARVFLPLFTGPPQAPEYAIFRLKHIADILNLIIVIFPGFLVVVSLWLIQKKRLRKDKTSLFLSSLSLGSLLFLMVIDPLLGMARDWDLMSLTLLAPFLLLLHQLYVVSSHRTAKVTMSVLLVCAFITATYVAANVEAPASEKRFHSILQYYGAKDDTGWLIYTYYYLNRGNYAKAMELAHTSIENDIRKADFLHILGTIYTKTDHLDKAIQYYHQALSLKPYNTPMMNDLGQLYLQQGKYDKALMTLRKARKINPALTFVSEGIGLAHYRLGHIDSAASIADTLFMDDRNSPGGHLLKMIIAISLGDHSTAKHHFEEYLKYGSSRPDYVRISEYYGYLLEH